MGARQHALKFALALLLTPPAAACLSDDERCDDGQVEGVVGGCIDPPPGDATADGGDGHDNQFSACATDADCADGIARYCGVLPGTSSGFCVVANCARGGDDCPAGTVCADASTLLEGAPTICVPPGTIPGAR